MRERERKRKEDEFETGECLTEKQTGEQGVQRGKKRNTRGAAVREPRHRCRPPPQHCQRSSQTSNAPPPPR